MIPTLRRRHLRFSAALLGTVLSTGSALAADPTSEQCLAANESSISLRTAHQLRASRKELLTCIAESCPGDIQKECIRRMDQVTSAIPTLVFQARDNKGGDLSLVKVTMDGETLVERLAGVAVAVEPGEHTFRLQSDTYPVIEKKLLINESEKERRVDVVFARPGDEHAAAHPSRTYDILALSSAGVGVVGLGIGAVFGLKAISRHNAAEDACPQDCSDEHGVQLWNQAADASTVSTIGFAVGAAGVASAVTFWVLGNKARDGESSMQAGFAPGRVLLRGAW